MLLRREPARPTRATNHQRAGQNLLPFAGKRPADLVQQQFDHQPPLLLRRLTHRRQRGIQIRNKLEIVEPDGWEANGGTWGSIRYYQGTLIIRAPDFMHRQIGGYPFPIRPTGSARRTSGGTRYVTFGAGFSEIDILSPPPEHFTGVEGNDQGGKTGNNAP